LDLLNPAAGGGLSNAKLQLANAAASDVLSGKKFYSKDKTLKTGTFSLAATATPEDVVSGKTFFAGSTTKKMGSYSAGTSGSFTIGSNQSSATFDIGFVPNAAYVKIHSYGRDAEFFGIAGTSYKVSGSLNQFSGIVNGSAAISGSTLKISNLSYDSYTVTYSFRK